MGFKKALNEAINNQGLTGKQVSELTGISASMISEYRNGTTPTPERKRILCEKLGIKEEEKKIYERKVDFVDLDEVAARLGISRESVMCCLQQNQFPMFIGLCWHGRHTKTWSYRVYRKPFEKMMEVIGEK